MLEKFIQIFYPNVCGICEKINFNSLCKKCELKLKDYMYSNIIDYRHDKSKNYSYYINVLRYDGLIRKMLIDYKFNEKSYLYKTFTKIILKNEKTCGFLQKYDIIIPVPIHSNRRKNRGYNQSELIAKDLGKKLGIKMINDVLLKEKNNPEQSGLGKTERESNVINVYKIINSEKIKGKKVILVDDIYTTGNTVNECCRMLKKTECNEIMVLTIAKD